MQKSYFTHFKNVKTANGVFQEGDIAKYLIESSFISSKKEGACFSMARFKSNKRSNKNFIEASGVPFDFDHVKIEVLANIKQTLSDENIHAILYSSFSNGLIDGTANFRVVIPFSYAVNSEQFLKIWNTLSIKFDFKNDIACKDPSRVMYVPATHPDRKDKAFFEIIDGLKLNPDDFLKKNYTLLKDLPAALNNLKNDPAKIGRNTWLTSEAGKLITQGITEETLKKTLTQINKNKFTTPLPEDEVNSILKSVSKYIKTNEDNSFHETFFNKKKGKKEKKEAINPKDIFNQLSIKYNFLYLQGDYYVFIDEHNYWKKVDREYFDTLIAKAVIASGMDFYKSKEVSNIKQAVQVFATKKPQPIPFWITNDPLQPIIKTLNGSILLQNMLVNKDFFQSGKNPDYLDTGHRSIVFDTNSTCPSWDNFLAEMLSREQINLLQEYFGYCLIPDTSLGKMLFLIGEGANGKSVICLMFRLIIGESYCSFIPLEAMDIKRTYNLSSMIGSLVNICEEIGEIDKAEEGLLKNLVTGGRITVEKKFRDPIDVTFKTKLIFATNNFPKFRDKTSGLWRRIIPISFERQILDESKQNKNLINPEWWNQSGELPGILNWALEGLCRLKKRGHFIQSEEINGYLKKLKLISNPTLEFIEDNLAFKNCSELPTTKIYVHYTNWAKENGFSVLSANSFAEQVKKCFGNQVHINKNPVYRNGARVRVWMHLEMRNDISNNDQGVIANSSFPEPDSTVDTDDTDYLF